MCAAASSGLVRGSATNGGARDDSGAKPLETENLVAPHVTGDSAKMEFAEVLVISGDVLVT